MHQSINQSLCYILCLQQEPPFIQWKNKTPISNFSGDVNGLLEGFCIDILDEIKTLLNFKYNISLVPDGKFGGKKTYGWTGMVRVLHDKVYFMCYTRLVFCSSVILRC